MVLDNASSIQHQLHHQLDTACVPLAMVLYLFIRRSASKVKPFEQQGKYSCYDMQDREIGVGLILVTINVKYIYNLDSMLKEK